MTFWCRREASTPSRPRSKLTVSIGEGLKLDVARPFYEALTKDIRILETGLRLTLRGRE